MHPLPVGADPDASTLTVTLAGAPAPVTLRHTEALFGAPAYGGTISARLYYPAAFGPNGCSLVNLTADPSMPPGSVLLLDRSGACPFCLAVANAQAAGAVGVVLVDNLGVCGVSPPSVCPPDACSRCPLYGTPACACSLPIMGGTCPAATIPSFLVGREDGATLRGPASFGLPTPPHALASMRWDVPSGSGGGRWALWHSPNDPATASFRSQLTPYLPYLASSGAEFRPQPYIFDGRALGCSGPEPVFDCGTQCVNDGWYCALDPDGDVDAGVSGGDVVLESVRSLCVAAQAEGDGDGSTRWWAYSSAFQEQCGGSASTWTASCSYSVMRGIGMDESVARDCVAAANASASMADWTNTLLQKAVDDRTGMAIVALPSLVVNGQLLRGAATAGLVLTALCAGAAVPLPYCACLSVPTAALPACVAAASGGGPPDATTPWFPAWATATLVLACCGGLTAVVLAVRSHAANARLNEDVHSLLAEYRQLAGPVPPKPEGEAPSRGGGGGLPVPRWLRRLVARLLDPPLAAQAQPVFTSSVV